MTRRRWLLFGLGLIALAVVLTLSYGEVLRERLLRSILYELWLWELRLESLPFGLVWMLFLVVGSLGVYMTILDLVLYGRTRAALPERVPRTGPVHTLAHKIELACHGELARWNVHRLVSDLALQWIVLRAGVSEGEARRRFAEIVPELHGALDLEFPRAATRRGWLWLSERLPTSFSQKKRRLEEIAQLTDILEDFAGEAYDRACDRR
uniref:Uncharacterized protein n=1 Tax=Acetithermum autotrophicum TaxID=1446466 RepID=H5SVT0_ACEAU|nr:hypothetical protein HGMM_OP4C349 [Candidatus Acetothermum autotrophicum]